MEIKLEDKVKNAIKWINGLSNTKLPQGRGELGSKLHGYCCLGYGCKRLNIYFQPKDADSTEFRDSIGLINSDGGFNIDKVKVNFDQGYHIVDSLIDLNDSVKLSFRKISTFIKNNLEELFEQEVAIELSKYYEK